MNRLPDNIPTRDIEEQLARVRQKLNHLGEEERVLTHWYARRRARSVFTRLRQLFRRPVHS